MDIFLLRHGEAGKRVQTPSKDEGRALTTSGREEIQKVGEALADWGFDVEKIATSPLRRCKETALIVAKPLRKLRTVEEWDELKPEGDRSALYERLSRFKPDAAVLLVGHEPYLSTAIGEMMGAGAGSRLAIKKGGMAKLFVTTFSPKPLGELRWLMTPRQLKKL